MSDGITDMMRERDDATLEELERQHTHVIRNFCNAIGCKECPLNRKPDPCDSIILQDKIMKLEFKYL